MTIGPRYKVPFRRRREGRTDYRQRLRLLRSEEPRAIVRMSNRRVRVSLTRYDPTGDRVLVQAESQELSGIGFPPQSLASTPAAYLTGYLAGLRAKRAGAESAILDAGLRHPTHGGRVLGALRGLLDAGVEIPHAEETKFPPKARLDGTHLPHKPAEPIEAFRDRLLKLAEASGGSA